MDIYSLWLLLEKGRGGWGGVVAGTKVQKQQLRRKKNKKDVRRGKKKRRSSKTGSVCSIFENEGVSLVVRINSITSCIERGNNVRSLFLCTFCCCVWWQSAHVDVNTVGIMMHPSSPITSSWSKILTSWKHDFNYFLTFNVVDHDFDIVEMS